MNLFAISGILVFITGITMAIFILAKTPQNPINHIWVYFSFLVTLWGISTFEIASTTDCNKAMLWWKIAHVSITLMPCVFTSFVFRYLNIRNFRILIIIYLIGFFFLGSILTGNLVSHPIWMFNSFYYYYQRKSPLYWLFFIFWTFTIIYNYWILYQRQKIENIIKKKQIQYFIISTAIGFTAGGSSFLPAFGFNIYPAGNLIVPLYALIMAYAIFKYQFFEIKIVIKRGLVYSFLATLISIIYFIGILVSQRIFHEYLGYPTTIAASVIIAIIFTPLKNMIQLWVDKIFFKDTQNELIKQNAQLKKEIIASERMKSIAILASGMAHEIKNPLTPIKTFCEQLPSKLNDKEFLLKFSRIINKEVNRIDSLVQELLNFAKPSPPQLKKVNVHQLIGQTLDLLNNEIIRHKIRLNTSFENKNILINIDPQQIKQALLNIFLNAIEAMPNGGTLSISTSVIASEAKQSLIIEISDTGCGIDTKDLSHIFDPFFSKKDHGTGLGLSITHEIIKNHNGKILAESELGRGTAFKIELPL